MLCVEAQRGLRSSAQYADRRKVSHSLKSREDETTSNLADTLACVVSVVFGLRLRVRLWARGGDEGVCGAQEMEEVEKVHEEVVFDNLHYTAYQTSPLGRTILGTEQNIKEMTRDRIINYIQVRACVLCV